MSEIHLHMLSLRGVSKSCNKWNLILAEILLAKKQNLIPMKMFFLKGTSTDNKDTANQGGFEQYGDKGQSF